MKLVHNAMEVQIDFNHESPSTLVVESPVFLRMLVSDLKRQISGESGGFVFSESDLKELALEQECELIMDPFLTTDDNKRFTTKLLQSLKQIACSEEFFERTAQMEASLLQFALSLTQEIEETMIFSEHIETGSLLKILGIIFDFNDPNVVENLVTYTKAANSLLRKRLFVFVNIKSFLEDIELTYLTEAIHAMKCYVLFLENLNRKPFMNKEKCCIIDADLCEIF